MADDLDAVRRTARPTGDRQTPETAPQESAGTTNSPTLVSTDAGNATGDLRAKFLDTFLRVTRDTADGAVMAERFIAEGWRPLLPAAQVEIEAPLAVHFAAPYVVIGGRCRQLCMWCGHVLVDVPAEAPLAPHLPWPAGSVVKIEDGYASQVPYPEGDALPPGCCALPDEEQYARTASSGPTAQGIPAETESTLDGCICTENRCDYDDHDNPPTDYLCVPCGQLTEGTPCLANGPADEPVDPDDGYPVDLCGKHTGNCSNRCLLPAHHDGECDDDPRPDEAQETRAAADWPAEETEGESA